MSALLIARSEPRADASLPAILARNSPGMAIAAMMPMIATTMSSSISVKPLVLFISASKKKGDARLANIPRYQSTERLLDGHRRVRRRHARRADRRDRRGVL